MTSLEYISQILKDLRHKAIEEGDEEVLNMPLSVNILDQIIDTAIQAQKHDQFQTSLGEIYDDY